jgi:Mg2+ and Co2+ transporter CorA
MIAGKHLPKTFQLSSMEEILELDLTQLKKNNEVLWIDIDTPSKHDLDQIEVKFGLHPLTTEDVLEGNKVVENTLS